MDWRNIENGLEIPSVYYSDQPYVIKADDGAWVCCLTTGEGWEGTPGQYVQVMRSTDKGHNWTDTSRMEPKGAPENSYSVLLKTDYGRIYCFYNYNKDNTREVIANDPPFKGGICKRVDSQGYYCFRYSDDNGKTWSKERGEVPMRKFQWDRENPYNGEIMFFWNVGKPLVYDGDAYLSMHKVGELGEGFFVKSEGVLFKSANIMTEPDIDKLHFETLPEGDIGIRGPEGGGTVSEEHSYVSLSDGSFFTVFRTIDGRPGYSYSHDRGKSWEPSEYMHIKHPRAANFIWKLDSGDFLYWFHNYGGNWYFDRNPVWCLAGKEADGPDGKIIKWSQPEVLLYHNDPYMRISYPDLIQDGGDTYITETEKETARTHKVDRLFMEKLLKWDEAGKTISDGLVFRGSAGEHEFVELPQLIEPLGGVPALRTKDLKTGFSIDLWFDMPSKTGDILVDTRTGDGSGIALYVADDSTVRIDLSDGITISSWQCDPVLKNEELNHLAIIVDGGPKTISFVINGEFNDGGDSRKFGWGRYSPNLRNVNGSGKIKIHDSIKVLRVYDRALMTVEACSNYKAGGNV